VKLRTDPPDILMLAAVVLLKKWNFKLPSAVVTVRRRSVRNGLPGRWRREN